MVAAPAAATSKFRWAEVGDDDDDDAAGDLNFLLPPPMVEGPDENGVKRAIEYRLDDNNNKVKVTTTIRVSKISRIATRGAVERRSWAKFGDAVDQDAGSSSLTTVVSTEEIVLERPRAPGSKQEETTVVGEPKAGTVLMLCRTCGKKGDHWTARCPYKDLATQDNAPAPETAIKKGTYVPPSLRNDGRRPGSESMRRQHDENTVRITNLSEDTHEPDLHDLCTHFGTLTRVSVPLDQRTGMCRGFGFVNFANRADAEMAINKLNGYGYDSLILGAEWAPPRPNRD